MKRILSLVLVLVFFTLLLAGCGDKRKTETVYVTIADKSGKVVLAREAIKAKDLDGDEKITIFEALKAAHKTCPAGADGFAAENGEYGLSMTKLWGEDNGGAYGYYQNEAAAWALTDEVKEGDRIVAFSYVDTAFFSDAFCYFDNQEATVKKGETVTLTLTALLFDLVSYDTIPTAVAGATVTVNGTAIETKTDADGKITLTLEKGVNVISASSDVMTLVPPIAKITVK